MKLVVQFDLSHADLRAFDIYEKAVLGFLHDHGGVLEQRLRAVDGCCETHILSFPDRSAYDAYIADPRRAARAPVLAACGAKARAWEATVIG